MSTDGSLETLNSNLQSHFSAQVILVNHEKRLAVDIACSNIAISFNMLYLSVYQLIKQHIEDNTTIGKALCASRKERELVSNPGVNDEFQESDYSAAHFELRLVIDLIKQTIQQKRTT